jgi:hypothetical protein
VREARFAVRRTDSSNQTVHAVTTNAGEATLIATLQRAKQNI